MHQVIEHPKVIIVEGKDDLFAVREILNAQSRYDITVLFAGSKTQLVATARNALMQEVRVRKILLISDADENPEDAMKSLHSARQKILKLDPEVESGAFVIPQDQAGALENLLLQSLKKPSSSCAHNFAACLAGNQAQTGKAAFYATLIEHGHAPLIQRNLLQACCDFHHPCWDPLKAKITEFFK
ncbi:MAG: hypothetical protein RL095_2471 [Verrucomicrobiota bacterium]|jgi:5S rRNA maturation endonuclease (ribonuclease M5)